MTIRARLIVAIDILLILLCLFLAFAVLSGCSWNSQSRTVSKERERIVGTVGGLPVDVVREREATSATEAEGEQQIGFVDALGQAAGVALQGGSSLATGGAAGLAVGLLGMGWAWLQKRKAVRQRDEIIDGVERSKDSLGEKWADLTAALEKEQSRDTKEAVKARVG